MSAAQRQSAAPRSGAAPWSGLPQPSPGWGRPVVMWAPYRYGVFSWLQSTDQQIAETVDFLRGELLKGVTDGSNAPPGMVGEYVEFAQRLTLAPSPSPAQSQTPFNFGTLSPGDWDCWALGGIDAAAEILGFRLVPVPPGFANEMVAWIQISAGQEAMPLMSTMSRANTTAPTSLAFTLYYTGSNTIDIDLRFYARRMR